MHEYTSDPAGRSFISYNRMKMDTAIVRILDLTKSISLTVRAANFVLFSRCLCGSNGSSQQLQLKVFLRTLDFQGAKMVWCNTNGKKTFLEIKWKMFFKKICNAFFSFKFPANFVEQMGHPKCQYFCKLKY